MPGTVALPSDCRRRPCKLCSVQPLTQTCHLCIALQPAADVFCRRCVCALAARAHGCALTAARLLSISTVTGLSIAVLVYAAASFSGDGRGTHHVQLTPWRAHCPAEHLLKVVAVLLTSICPAHEHGEQMDNRPHGYMRPACAGGHLNPAITLAFLLARKITAQRALCYWGAQVAAYTAAIKLRWRRHLQLAACYTAACGGST